MKGTGVYVPSWGLPIVFNPAFNAAPTVTPQARHSGYDAVAVNVTTAGCTLYVKDESGRCVGGLVDWTAQ